MNFYKILKFLPCNYSKREELFRKKSKSEQFREQFIKIIEFQSTSFVSDCEFTAWDIEIEIEVKTSSYTMICW